MSDDGPNVESSFEPAFDLDATCSRAECDMRTEFLRLARSIIPKLGGLTWELERAADLAAAILGQSVALAFNIHSNPHSTFPVREAVAEEFLGRVRRCHDVMLAQETLNLRQRKALWCVNSAVRFDSERPAPERAIDLLSALFACARGVPRADSDGVPNPHELLTLTLRVLEVWASDGGKGNAKKWDLVQELFRALGLAAASAAALRATWKQERAEQRRRFDEDEDVDVVLQYRQREPR